MDTYSSGEELVIKARKPYTITKQRERWTEEEHNRFLEALKLYGRAWQRIEEHIGTKTAVQIRSHAQKFFSKLEKEALAKGVPISQTVDIEIPPPRPKRKPSNPYPRKTGSTVPTAKDGKPLTPTSSHCKQVLDLEKETLPEKIIGADRPTNSRANGDIRSDVFSLLQETNGSSVTSVNQSHVPTSTELSSPCHFREVVPSLKETIQDDGAKKASCFESSCTSNGKSVHVDEIQATQTCPKHVPVHVIDGSLGTCTQTPSSETPIKDSFNHPTGEVHSQPNPFANPAASTVTDQNNAARSGHQAFPCYPSFPHMSAFSNLIVSTLLQNPAAHAAASIAATFWPVETPGSLPSRQMNSTPSLAAIAAATVAAATAWWAAHGLLPVCAPLHNGFPCAPASTTTVSPMDTDQAPASKNEKVNVDKTPKLPTSSTSDSEECADANPNIGVKAAEHEKDGVVTELDDANKTKSRKQVDRSSCGSNTPSGSDAETEALEKNEKDNEETKEADANHPAVDYNNRRSRSTSNSNTSDSWKEVSEEGRMAFQALFSRGTLPQSFSPTNKDRLENIEEDKQMTENNGEESSALDLNSHTRETCSDKNITLSAQNNAEESLLSIGLGQGKLKARRTGFKPYKRCSVEAKENMMMNGNNQVEENGPKRIRLEGEAST